jgi:hypothetical protein
MNRINFKKKIIMKFLVHNKINKNIINHFLKGIFIGPIKEKIYLIFYPCLIRVEKNERDKGERVDVQNPYDT